MLFTLCIFFIYLIVCILLNAMSKDIINTIIFYLHFRDEGKKMRKEALLLYNPCSGHKEVLLNLDYIAERVQEMGYSLKIYRSHTIGAIERYIIEEVNQSSIDLIIVSGGDGTINECVNGMMKKSLDIPLGILPLGTSNDFAHALGISCKLPLALDVIAEGYQKMIDIGKANDRYFINVCSMGALSSVSQSVSSDIKNKFGKLAYYTKGFDAVYNYKPMDLEVITSQVSFRHKFFLVLVFNGKGAGGFMKLASEADASDGLFDIVCFKDVYFYDMPPLFFKVLQGQHLENPNVIYFKTNRLTIKCHLDDDVCISDVDGELGPKLPIDLSIISSALKICIPKHFHS